MIGRLFQTSLFVLALSSCGSSDQRKLEAMVAERLDHPANLQVSNAIVYRDGDARKACLTAQWDNQWGEQQPRAMFLAWYIPKTKTWHTDNPHVPAGDCESFRHPDWKAKSLAAEEAARAAEVSHAHEMSEEHFERLRREQEAQDSIDARRGAELNRLQAEGSARADAEADRREAEAAARERAADAALEESLRRGPVNNSQ